MQSVWVIALFRSWKRQPASRLSFILHNIYNEGPAAPAKVHHISSDMSCDAIVIGSGIAGIKAASDLARNGVDTLVLEARDRLGGRIYTTKTDSGIPLDLGASWFHDCLVNPLLKKTYEKGHTMFYYDDGTASLYSKKHGLVSDNLKLQPVADEIEAYLSEVCAKQCTRETDISVREACYRYLKEKGYTLTEEQLQYAPQLVRFFELWIGSDWTNLSARLLVGDAHLGRNAMVTNGYSTFYKDELDEYAGYCGKKSGADLVGSHILLKQVVMKVSFDDITKKITVTTNGSEFTCDYLLCSAPLSILQLKDQSIPGYIEWSPPLPAKITNTLKHVSFSALGKVFLEFDHCFWSRESDRFLCLPEPDNVLTEAIQLGKNLSFATSREPAHLKPMSSPDPSNYIVLFMNLQRAAGVPVLLALVSQPLTHFIESASNESVWKFFKPLVQLISGTSVAPSPVSIHTSNWTNDPFARGSYAGLTVGDDLDACIDALVDAKDIFDGKGRVRFMGEGVIKEGNGCVHGAWTTGQREAAKVIKLINRGKL